MEQKRFIYQGKVFGLSVVWHAIWFLSIGTLLNPLVRADINMEKTVFLGALLSKTELLPKPMLDSNRDISNLQLLSNMRDVINTNNISKLSQLPYKQHVYTQDNSIEPTPTEPNPSLLRSDSNKVAIVELDFKVEANKNKFYQYRALPHYCEFKYSMGEDRVLWIERIISSGDPQLDMELERVVKDKILNSLQWSNSGRVKVNLVY